MDRSHLTPSQRRDALRYLMEDADESTSENNIRILGISDFPNSPHQVNKKAYNIQYRSRIGFNLNPLPMVIEFFPPEMNNVSVTPEATTISISNYASNIFTKCIKTLVNFHRWNSTPPQFIYLELHRLCFQEWTNGNANRPVFKRASFDQSQLYKRLFELRKNKPHIHPKRC